MAVHVLLEHPIASYASWKVAFDRDPVDREGSGVRAYRILRPIDRPDDVTVDLEFDDRQRQSPSATRSSASGSPRTRAR